MWRCDKCAGFRLDTVKTCNCKEFNIIDEDGEEHSAYGMDEEDAALNYAESSNCSNDYYLMNETVRITVNGKEYDISAEPDVHYSADKV